MKHRLNVSAYGGGYDDDPHAFEEPILGPFEWNKDTVYHHKLVWGSGHMRWYMNGELLVDRDYSTFGSEYLVPNPKIRLGSGLSNVQIGGYQTPLNITYSNFRFTRTEDIERPRVDLVEYTKEKDRVSEHLMFLSSSVNLWVYLQCLPMFIFSLLLTENLKWLVTPLFLGIRVHYRTILSIP
jgi:hypothetical protein